MGPLASPTRETAPAGFFLYLTALVLFSPESSLVSQLVCYLHFRGIDLGIPRVPKRQVTVEDCLN